MTTGSSSLRRAGLGVVVVAVALLGVHRAMDRARDEAASVGATGAYAAGSSRPAVQQAGSPQSGPSTATGPTAQAGPYRVGDPRFGEVSAAQVEWLNRHRYAHIDDLQHATATAGQLTPRDLEGGIDAALIARAEVAAMFRPDLRELALSRLEEAAVDGSMGALDSLHRAYQPRAHRDVVRAEAYARMLEARGDWVWRVRPYALDELQGIHANVLAQHLLDRYDLARRQRGLPPLRRDPRPGIDEALRSAEQARAQIEAAQRALRSARSATTEPAR